MTQWLLRLFVPEYENQESPQVRARIGLVSGLVGIGCNVLLFAAKLLAGVLSGAVSIMADAVNNLSDASSALVTIAGFRLSGKPADQRHPYGHARFEYLAGLAVAAMILLIGVEVAKTAIGKILNPQSVGFTWLTALILGGSIAVKLWLSGFYKKMGIHIHSTTLIATATDCRNDVLSTAAVLTAALVEQISDWRIDGIMGLAVAVFVLYSGAVLAKQTISPLLGEGASPELTEKIVACVSAHPMVLGYHDLMVHDYGPGKRFATVHVEMDHREDPVVCHDIIDNLERECLEQLQVQLVIHYDPIIVGDDRLDRLRRQVLILLQSVDSRISIHDFRMVTGKHHTKLVFDMALPDERMPQRESIRAYVEKQLNTDPDMQYHTVITYDTLPNG